MSAYTDIDLNPSSSAIKGINGPVISLKMMNKDYAYGVCENSICTLELTTQWESAIKVSFNVGVWYETCKGSEARIPVQYHELLQVSHLNDHSIYIYYILLFLFINS